jgi:hypothetical protein
MVKTRSIRKLRTTIVLVLLFISTVKPERKQKISDVNVLLPLCHSKPCSSVSYRISAYAGCYEWSTDRPALINLQQLLDTDSSEPCFSSVIISTRIEERVSNHDSIWLTARDKKSNEEFRCKVGFGNVRTLTIAKRFDHMNVGEIVELTAIVSESFFT